MATVEELSKAFNVLIGAGLNYAPRGDEVAVRVESWKVTLADVPGDLLIQAAVDIAKSEDDFPTVAAVRRQAWKVKTHNGVAAAPDPFRAPPEDLYPFISRVTSDGWLLFEPGKTVITVLAAELAHAIASLEEKYQDAALPTDAELANIDALIDLYGLGE